MNTTTHHALHGLLLLLVEAQNILRQENRQSELVRGELSDLVESAHARELVQQARTLLEAPRGQRFFAIVTEQDLPKDHEYSVTARGPIMMETYLDGVHTARDQLEQFAKRNGFDRYGWVRIAEVHVDIPAAAQRAIPAAAAGVHA